MSFIIVDVEADGPIPHKYSMVSFGAIVVEPSLTKTFYGKVRPVSEEWIPEALAISGVSREEHLTFENPETVMVQFKNWMKANSKGNPLFLSDNLAFDWQWINYYFHYFLNENPFGFSGRRIGDLYSGMVRDLFKASDYKKFRKTKHTHHPVEDAKGNAEAMLALREMGLKFPF